MAAWYRPEVLRAYGAMYVDMALVQVLWYFDLLASFLIVFAFAYGLFSFSETLFSTRSFRRPRIWTLPLLFAGVTLGFFLGIDTFVVAVVSGLIGTGITALMEWFPGVDGDRIFEAVKIAASVWFAGCVFFIAHALRGLFMLARTMRRLPAFSPTPAMRAALAATGVGGAVVVKAGPVGVPVVSCGLLKRGILVPENFAERYSSEEQYAICIHEGIHIRNYDAIKLLFLSFLKAVLWFDPVAGHAIKRMKTEMELFCDWAAVHIYRLDPGAYAALIVKAVGGVRRRQTAAPGFSDAYRSIAVRLGHVLQEPAMLTPPRVSRPGALFMTVALVTVIFAAAAFYAAIPPAPPLSLENQDMGNGDVIVTHSIRNGIFGQYAFFRSTKS